MEYLEKNKNKPLEFFNKTTYTENELLSWRVDFLRSTLQKTHAESKKTFNALKEQNNKGLTYLISKKIYKKFIVGTKLKDNKMVKKLKNKIKNKK